MEHVRRLSKLPLEEVEKRIAVAQCQDHLDDLELVIDKFDTRSREDGDRLYAALAKRARELGLNPRSYLKEERQRWEGSNAVR